MKIIHCADVHLDSRMLRHLSKEQAKERRNEILNTFGQMVTYAAKNDVAAIIIAGDLFDTSMISVTTRNYVRDLIVNNPKIEFYYLQGNHDIDNFLINLQEIPANLKLFDRKWTGYNVAGSDKVVISGVELSEKNHKDVYDSLSLDINKYNIVVLHGKAMPTKAVDDYESIGLDKLKNKSIDYLALGHYHSYSEEQLDSRGVYCYSGCLEGRGFDECGEYGFVLIDVDEKKMTSRRKLIDIAERNIYSVDIDATGCYTTSDVIQKITKALDDMKISGKSLVRIVIKGEVSLKTEINIDLIEKNFAHSFYVFKVEDKTKTLINYEEFMFDETLKGEFVRNVLKAPDIAEEDKPKIIRYGIQALTGEEI